MYDFVDKGDRHISLRPEMTASVCRSFAQHRPTTPWKVFYAGSNFRYEKPQRGRYRQFDQVGIEVLGVDDAQLDVEVIALAWEFYRRLGLRQVKLIVNSLGEPDERAAYVEALRAYFLAAGDALTEQSRATLDRNPLRVLDSKREPDQAVIAGAPTIADYRGAESAAHFDTVRRRSAGARHPVRRRAEAGPRPRLLPPHHLRVPGRHARLGAERARRRRALRRSRRGARRPGHARCRLRARCRPHAARLRRRGRVRRRSSVRSTRSSSTSSAGARRPCSRPPSATPGSPPTAATTTAR